LGEQADIPITQTTAKRQGRGSFMSKKEFFWSGKPGSCFFLCLWIYNQNPPVAAAALGNDFPYSQPPPRAL
jgi:hypothetical protein